MSYTSTMNYTPPDYLSLEYGKAVASKLRLDPALLQFARDNISRWKQQGVDTPAYAEWLGILNTESLEKIVELLEAESENSQRLRSSNPFAGLLTQKERNDIWFNRTIVSMK